ncbi:unknown [Firmicutes bacterium CAG:449]|nr:unknown [Firmicutes bacterium CAG:449]
MVLPYSINKIENIPSSIVCIGYFNQNYTLSNEENVENYTFKGFRLSFLVNEKLKLEDNKLDLKFFFSGLINNQEVGNKCYFISKDLIIDKNNK